MNHIAGRRTANTADYLAKPFNARELIARAHMQLQLGKKRRALEEAFDERTAELRTLTECRSCLVGNTDTLLLCQKNAD